jgi:hypothetical protein
MSFPAGAIAGAAAAAGAAIGASFQEFAKVASSGSFAISETGGKALLQAIRNLKDWIDENQYDAQRWGEEPQLGQSHGANVMKPHVANVATDGQGFLPNLLSLRASLDDAEAGIKAAMDNYAAMDERGAGRQQTA